MAYSIIAPSVTPENFGAGTNDSFINRFTNNLYGNFKAADGFSTMMQNQNSRLRRRPSGDAAAIAGSTESYLTDNNDAMKQSVRRAVASCNINGDNSPQCQAWRLKLDNINKAEKIAGDNNQAMLSTTSVLNTPSVLTRDMPILSNSVNSTLFTYPELF